MTKADVIPELLKSCPGFGAIWETFDPEERALLYMCLGDFADYLLTAKRDGRDDVLCSAGHFIGRMHEEGDEYVREAATIGILEAVQNGWAHAGEDPEQFRHYLNENSRQWWDSLNRFWAREIPYVGADIKSGLPEASPEDDTTTLYRPVGSKELELIAASGYTAFPPRLPDQPIFYPVLNEAYASQIARDWNVKASGAGYVTRFKVRTEFLAKYTPQVVGAKVHAELWVPAEELAEFNRNIVGPIKVITEFK